MVVFLGDLGQDVGIEVEFLGVDLLFVQDVMVLQKEVLVLLFFLLVVGELIILFFQFLFIFLHICQFLLLTSLVVLLLAADFKQLLIHFHFKFMDHFRHFDYLIFREVLPRWQQRDNIIIRVGEVRIL